MQELLETIPDGKIKDFIDGKFRSDTPEEYVRQNIERRLVVELDYSPEQIEIEFRVKLGSSSKRADIVIFPEGKPHNQDEAWVIIECKKEDVEPSNKKEGVEQLKSYMAACARAEWGMWTNGRYKAVFRKVATKDGFEWEEPNDIVSANGSADEVDRPTRDGLKNAVGDNLLFAFKTCHNHIYVTDGMQKQPAFFELLKVIFCKIYDERNFPHDLEFYATAKEKGSSDGRLTVVNRIGKIFEKVRKKYPAIFDANDVIKLQPRSLAWIVGELQRYSFLDSNIDVKGKAYEELVGANLRGDRGEFFTPRNVQAMAVKMLDISEEERVLDPACGTGGFLVIAMNLMIRKLRAKANGGKMLSAKMQEALEKRVQELAEQFYFGFDINPDLVKATKMNMVMNNDGAGNILRQDSLLHPHQWSLEFKKELAKRVGVEARDLKSEKDLSHFDVIATNPPFGSKLPIKDTETLEQYQLGHVWQKEDGRWMVTEELQSSQPPEILFIERCWQLLKPGGRLAIVLPDAILGAPGLEYVRYWILTHFRLVASIDLHPDTFQPRNGTQTSVLVLQRKTEAERQAEAVSRKIANYEVFMAQVNACGHDKRGNKLYKRDLDGNLLMEQREVERTELYEFDAHGTVTKRRLASQHVEDDDSPAVALEFLDWKPKQLLGW
ncbi:N-6 DNA methylase [Cerasicoccus frondis]|uniref:N-6 DNA methylase n=1 Tax=Cerasicoccus frondis TaxID=490090 RepID=UPI003CCD8D80